MPERSSSSVKVRKLDFVGLMEKLRKYALNVAGRKEVKAVILFGSLARGDYTPSSDIDVLIVVRKAAGNPTERSIPYMDPSLPLDLQPFVLTEEELLLMAGEGRKIVRELVEHGVLLAGDEEVLRKIVNLVSKYYKIIIEELEKRG